MVPGSGVRLGLENRDWLNTCKEQLDTEDSIRKLHSQMTTLYRTYPERPWAKRHCV